MLRWICSVKQADVVHTLDLLAKLGLCDLETTIRCRRLRCMDTSCAVPHGLKRSCT